MKYYFKKIKNTQNRETYLPLTWQEVLILIKAELIQQQKDTFCSRKIEKNIKTYFIEEYKWLIDCKYMSIHTTKLRKLIKMILFLLSNYQKN